MLYQRRAELYKISSFISGVVGVNSLCLSCILTLTLLVARCNYFLATALVRDNSSISSVSLQLVGLNSLIRK